LSPQYGLSRLVDRMEKAELLLRRACEEDGCEQVLSLTETGRTVRARMWPVYADVLVAEVEQRLDCQTALLLAKGLGRLAAPSAPDQGQKPGSGVIR